METENSQCYCGSVFIFLILGVTASHRLVSCRRQSRPVILCFHPLAFRLRIAKAVQLGYPRQLETRWAFDGIHRTGSRCESGAGPPLCARRRPNNVPLQVNLVGRRSATVRLASQNTAQQVCREMLRLQASLEGIIECARCLRECLSAAEDSWR